MGSNVVVGLATEDLRDLSIRVDGPAGRGVRIWTEEENVLPPGREQQVLS